MKRTCDKCGAEGAVLAPHTGRILCDPCFFATFREGHVEAMERAGEVIAASFDDGESGGTS